MNAPLSRGRRLAFTLATAAIVLATCEAGLRLVYLTLYGQAFPFEEYQQAMRAASRTGPWAAPRAGELRLDQIVEVLHPYLGYVLDPDRNPGASELGFREGQDDPLTPAPPGVVTVVVVGGSFAEGMSRFGETEIQRTLGEEGIESRVVTLALGGYKQPQQVMAVNWLLSLGARVDVVVNVDGFNEVALPLAESGSVGTHPFYPRMWSARTLGIATPDVLRQAGRIDLLGDWRRAWARLMRRLPRWSIVRAVVWRAVDAALEKRTGARTTTLELLGGGERDYLATGPDLGMRDGDARLEAAVRAWENGSTLLADLCRARGIAYLHFLQPNQYFATQRVLTPQERRTAFWEDHPYRIGVMRGYPLLLERGAALRERGIEFHDLTRLYDDVPEPIYTDDCCHPGQLGYEIAARAVAREIARVLRRPDEEDRSGDASDAALTTRRGR